MDAFIDNRSALYFWCHTVSSRNEIGRPVSFLRLPDVPLRAAALRNLDFCGLDFGPEPLHIAVASAKRRLYASWVVSHVCSGPLPAGSFIRCADNILVASPERCFLQMAQSLSRPKLIELGYFLCGTYAYRPSGRIAVDKVPLTSIGGLALFLQQAGSVKGVDAAIKALAIVGNNAASPQEAKLATALALPVKAGGFGFPRPVMNHVVSYGERERQQYGKRFSVLDLYWPFAKVAIEYDGEDYHSSPEAIARDKRKGSEMAARGITVLHVDKEQLASERHLAILAEKLARAMGRRWRLPTEGQLRRRSAVFQELWHR